MKAPSSSLAVHSLGLVDIGIEGGRDRADDEAVFRADGNDAISDIDYAVLSQLGQFAVAYDE
ncbi:hypothetical protein D9M70_636660 [compost metagenome]